MLNDVEPITAAMATTFWLGAAIQTPTGLYVYYLRYGVLQSSEFVGWFVRYARYDFTEKFKSDFHEIWHRRSASVSKFQ